MIGAEEHERVDRRVPNSLPHTVFAPRRLALHPKRFGASVATVLLLIPLVFAGCLTGTTPALKEGDRAVERIVRITNVSTDDACQRWLIQWEVHHGGLDVRDNPEYKTENVHYVDGGVMHVILASKAKTAADSDVGLRARERFEEGGCEGWYITKIQDEETRAAAVTNWTTSRAFSYSGLIEPQVCTLSTVPCVFVGESKSAHDLAEAGPKTGRIHGNVSWSPLPGETMTLYLFARDAPYEAWHEDGGTIAQASPVDFDFTHDDETYYELVVHIQTQAGGLSREHAFEVTGVVEDTVA